MRRQGRRGPQPATVGVGHVDVSGMQMQLVLDTTREGPALFGLEIFRVADDRVADMGGMDAELVGAAGICLLYTSPSPRDS